MILDNIVDTKRREVALRKETITLRELETAAGKMHPTRNFKAAIGVRECAIITEVKRRSPSRGVFRMDFDPVRIALEYEGHGAAALSVLTDATFFGGSDADLTAVKEAVALPILRKDFIIDRYQIYETRAIGADALLLIAAILSEAQLREYLALSASLDLAALVEVHDVTELEKAIGSGSEIIGINNRDLKTFRTDLRTTPALASLIPTDRIAVSESGIRNRRDIETLMKAGVRAFLIGETLIAAPEIGPKLMELMGR